ncbi:MAG: TIGR00725 family protein [Nitrososphaerota archaeon]|nr:TIGR00725 family protein [Nitrososphaerota archaeon]MDG6966202.1 TIGR00725 family protein [Nitrososphaerota archaeon]MDG6977637.1 TIGR00725 family protein [Nitrososphaerota archaeon]MDG6981455.1 TIGR00725 family protein [Nitrososphaerota archaeon]MDG7005514.1 TIGR00725 family protein [Nitrososphaerota archaeon]
MARHLHVSVVGYNEDSCTETARDAAYQVGRAVAEGGGIVVCGGLGGVMEAACRGASDGGGISVGVVPSEEPGSANAFCDVVVATGIGGSRNFLVAYSGDAMVVVGGGAGTLIEMAAAYQAARPIVAVRGTGGAADEWAGRYIDQRSTVKVLAGASPKDAVRRALRAAKGVRVRARPIHD